jgi:hypothetical protein
MERLKPLDLLVGVKAEQSLRDAVRTVIEQADDDLDGLELAPVGRKDWVAGRRIGAAVSFGELGRIGRAVLTQLLGLDSRQRIRQENVRLYVVQPPVPVFKDPEPAEELVPEPAAPEPASVGGLGGPTVCPICEREVHSFNLQHDTTGKVVGCFLCGGDPGRR